MASAASISLAKRERRDGEARRLYYPDKSARRRLATVSGVCSREITFPLKSKEKTAAITKDSSGDGRRKKQKKQPPQSGQSRWAELKVVQVNVISCQAERDSAVGRISCWQLLSGRRLRLASVPHQSRALQSTRRRQWRRRRLGHPDKASRLAPSLRAPRLAALIRSGQSTACRLRSSSSPTRSSGRFHGAAALRSRKSVA